MTARALIAGLVAAVGATLGATGAVEHFVRARRQRRPLPRVLPRWMFRGIRRDRDAVHPSRRPVTVLFADLRGFTSIAETVEPGPVVEMVSDYLHEMTGVVTRHGGIVDKYIGAGIMALYNAPLEDAEHELHAVRSALELQERTLVLSRKWKARLGCELRTSVGIASGVAVVGALGPSDRPQYTAVGDPVNQAARLHALTKDYDAPILIAGSTHAAVRGRVLTRELGTMPSRSQARTAKLYAVLPGDIRKYPRALLDAGATLLAVGRGKVCAVRTRDIGAGGIAIVGLPADWPVGARIEIRCEGGRLPKAIVAEGHVVWQRDDMAGVAFTAVDPDAAPTILGYVAAETGS